VTTGTGATTFRQKRLELYQNADGETKGSNPIRQLVPASEVITNITQVITGHADFI